MDKPLSRTAAIKTASRYVTIGAHGRQYVVYHPHSFDNLTGPNTASTPRDWSRAVAARTRMRVDLALHLMGISDDEPYSVAAEVERAHHDGITTVESLVAHVARRLSDRAWIGKTVESGEGEDHDTGKVRAVLAPGVVEVAWDSQVITPANTSALRIVNG